MSMRKAVTEINNTIKNKTVIPTLKFYPIAFNTYNTCINITLCIAKEIYPLLAFAI